MNKDPMRWTAAQMVGFIMFSAWLYVMCLLLNGVL
jgi:hypothetical protein